MHSYSIIKPFTDIPLSDIEKDMLGRESLVDLIVSSINELAECDHPCTVYGIYGKWGDFVKNRLLDKGKKDNLSIVEYNPWLVNSDEGLLREFFRSILKKTPDDTLKDLFKKYGSLAIFASKTIINAFLPKAGDVLAEGIGIAQTALEDSEDSVSELKSKVSDAIGKSGRHLIIMIDDVDRLDKEELHTTLRLIRQVADFHNCIYIVAMDVDMVSKAIGGYHGGGAPEDGRKYLDKIVQVPITLPHIAEIDMCMYATKELHDVLKGYVSENEISLIAERVSPFLSTIRSLKRYCNQLRFVLPDLNGEVNIEELCVLEAIKNVSSSAYDRIYENRASLQREIASSEYAEGEDRMAEIIDDNYAQAISDILENLTGHIKRVVESAIDRLFNLRSSDYQSDLDEKRIVTSEYFMKYFVMKAPCNVIPDRKINELQGLGADDARIMMEKWIGSYPASEIKRAVIQFIRSAPTSEEQSALASVMASALSVTSLAKGLPMYTNISSQDISAFVPNAIIHRYMFSLDPETTRMNVVDPEQLDNTLKYIFSKSEMNYCMNMLSSSNRFFGTSTYDGHNVMPILTTRFQTLGFDEQFKYSKFLLSEFFRCWQKIEVDSYNAFADNLFSDSSIPYLKIFDKMIDGSNDSIDVETFVKLFYQQISAINARLSADESGRPFDRNSVKIYSANHRIIIRNLGLR